jgi:hypothetical protein
MPGGAARVGSAGSVACSRSPAAAASDTGSIGQRFTVTLLILYSMML